MEPESRTIKTGTLYRSFDLDRAGIDKEKRTVPLSFSSETESVERWFGIEILDHSPRSVRMDRLKSGRAPLLVDHDRTKQVGVVDHAEIATDRKGRAVVRFGKSERAEQEFQDVLDGVRTNVSVGYVVHEMRLEKAGEGNSPDVFRAIDWEPFEISLVSIDADTSVGVGRGQDGEETTTKIIDTRSATTMKIDEVKNERSRVAEILALGAEHGYEAQAREAINEGHTADQFRAYVLGQLKSRGLTPVDEPYGVDIGLSRKEVRQFSFLRALRALANPTDKAAQEAAGFEFEASRAVADLSRREPQGLFVPAEVARYDMLRDADVRSIGRRDMQTGIGSQGGYLVDTALMAGSFIEKLENSMVCVVLGAILLRDLVGDIAIPKQTGGATSYWVGEGEDVTESTPALGQVRLAPKTIGAFTDLTRKFLKQSSMDAELFIRNELGLQIAIAKDAACLAGPGTPNIPIGILNTTGIGSVTLNAVNTPDWEDVVDLETAVAVDNALVGRLAYVTNATICGAMKKTERASGYPVYVMENGKVNGYPCMMSNQVSEKHIIFGNWADLIIASWGGVDINTDTATLSKSGGVRVVALEDTDMAVRHPESFADGYKSS